MKPSRGCLKTQMTQITQIYAKCISLIIEQIENCIHLLSAEICVICVICVLFIQPFGGEVISVFSKAQTYFFCRLLLPVGRTDSLRANIR